MVTFDKKGFAATAGELTVFNTNPDNGEYVGSSVEYFQVGVGLPAGAYVEAPPVNQSGYAVCRTATGLSWEQVVDHRGKMVYEVSTGNASRVTKLGALPDALTLLVPSTAFDIWDGQGWVTDIAARKNAMTQDITKQKESRINDANQKTQFLQTQLALGMISNDDKAVLIGWVKYIQAVKAINPEDGPDINWPKSPA